MKSTTFTNPSNRKFIARLIEKGDNYGRDNCLTNEDEPLIQFSDITNPDFEQGLPAYCASTIAEIEDGQGLCLMGYEPIWDLSAENIAQTKADLL